MFVLMKSTSNPWQTVDSEVVYENPWIKVREDQVINPAGNPGIYGKVGFKNLAVAIIPLDHQRNTWIVGQYRYTLDQYSWEVPMGGVPFDEDPLKGAQRELLEETGITAVKWKTLLNMHPSNSVTDEIAIAYIAEELTLGTPQFEETEKLQIKKIPFQELLELVMAGKITDGISIACVLKAARVLGL
jgi:8-oxo-dGTP pyrophosphatase MutT (NUDIX family)